MHGATLLGADDKPLRPAILWNDGRSFAECAELKRRVPDVEKHHRQPGHAGLHGAQDAVGRGARAGDRQGDPAGAPAQGLCPAAPLGRGGLGDVGRLGHVLARRRQARLGRRPARRDRPSALGHAGARRGLGGLGLCSRRRSPKAWGLEGRKIPIAGGGGDNAASAIGVGATAAGPGLRLARHLGRRLLGDRQVREPARADAARLLPRAAAALARHVGHAVGRFVAVLDRRGARAREGHRRAGRRRGALRPVEGRGRGRAGLPALSQRRAHPAQRRRGDGDLRPAFAPRMARTRSSTR